MMASEVRTGDTIVERKANGAPAKAKVLEVLTDTCNRYGNKTHLRTDKGTFCYEGFTIVDVL